MLSPALAVIAGVALADGATIWLLFVAALALVCAWYSRKYVLVLTVLLAVFAAWHHWSKLSHQQSVSAQYGSWWELEVSVDDESSGHSVIVRGLKGELEGVRMRVWLGENVQSLQLGDVLEIQGRVVEPRAQLNPKTFPEREWLYRRGVSAAFVPQQVNHTGRHVWSLRRMAIQVRQWVKQRLLLGVDPQSDEAKIIVAMALGERPLDAQELIDSYRLSGAIHVFAVSGLHVMMIGGIAAFFLKMLGLPRSVWVGGVILTMVAYALVTGLRPPALRAAVMGSVLLSAWVVGRKVVLVNSVAVAVIIALLLNGHMLFWPGFQLSFAVLIAIALFGNIGTRLFSWVSRVDPFLPRSLYSKWQEIWLQTRRRVQAALVVAASAWMGSSPLTLTHFGIVTPMSVLVSLPVVCLLYLSLCLGVVSLCAGLLWSPLGHVVNSANAQLASVSHAVVKGAANTPAAYHKSAPWSKGERVVIYALENGASANYLGLGGGVMLDVADKRQFQREVLPSLVKNGAGIDSVILSHEDHRHVGGLDALLEHFSPKQILVGDRGKADFGEAFVPRVLTVKGGERYPLGSRSWIESIDWAESQHGVADDRGAVFLLHWSGRKILFLHDVGYRFERWVVDSNNDLAADIIVWSGHARDESWGDDLLRVLKPSWLIGPRKVETAQNVGQINLLEKGALEIKVGELGLKADGYGSGVWLLE